MARFAQERESPETKAPESLADAPAGHRGQFPDKWDKTKPADRGILSLW